MKELSKKFLGLPDLNKNRVFLGFGLLAILIIGSFSFSVFAQDSPFSIMPIKKNSDNPEFVPGQLIVGLKTPDPNFHAKASVNGGQEIDSINQINAHLVKIPIKNEEKFIQAMSKNPNVQYVERNGIAKALDVPNDSWYYQQWGTTRIGMESVWSPSFDQGSGIMIAVIDEGLFYDHPDFAGTNIRTDIDKDFVNDDFDTRPTSNCFFNGESESHGTWVTGVIAATINNNIGVAGSGQFDILPLRALDACGSGNLFDVADAIIYAADQDVDVINLSLGHESWNNITLENAVNYASGYPDEIVVVAASGNGGNSLISYPAGFEKVISVGATDFNDNITGYSQYGSTIDLSAPGGSDLSQACSPSSQITWILTTGTDPSQQHGYYCVSGTSFASPLVAATAGLVKASSPCATDEDIKSHLEQWALDKGAPGRDDSYGHGIVQADVALSNPLIPTFPCEGENNPPTANAGADQNVNENTLVNLDGSASSDSDGTIASYTWTQTGGTIVTLSGANTATPSIPAPEVGAGGETLTFSLIVTDDDGAFSLADTVDINLADVPVPITITGISPACVQNGFSINVIISGAGFENGASVTLSNGSGPTPTATVTSVSPVGTEINALITTKDGGPPRDRLWDVTSENTDSSSSTLENGFLVANNPTCPLPIITIDDVTQAEGDSGSIDFTFTVTRSDNIGTISVDYVTADDIADSGDYTSISSTTLSFVDGGLTTKTITVNVSGDTDVEPDETFFVNLSNCSGCTISDGQGLGTITNDDTPLPSISVNDLSILEGNAGQTELIFTVTRSGDTNGISSVVFASQSNSATPGEDYGETICLITFLVGATESQCPIAIFGDTTPEPDETFFVNLSLCEGCAISDFQGVGTITDDDTVLTIPAPPVLSSTGHTHNTIDISWTIPDDGGSPITGYTYEWSDDEFSSVLGSGNSGSNSATISGLDSTTTYDIRVFALNALGVSDYSNVVSVTTSAAPTGLEITGVSPNVLSRSTQFYTLTIIGSGFGDGVSNVTITGGSGPAPSISIVSNIDSEITADITLKSGGPPRSTTWTLTVLNSESGSSDTYDILIGP